MPVRLVLDYVNSCVSGKVHITLGAMVTGPLAVVAAIQSEWILIPLGIAGGVCAFLWGIRKYPIDELINNANKAIKENFELKDRNAHLAEENESLRVRVAHAEEDSKTVKLQNPKTQES